MWAPLVYGAAGMQSHLPHHCSLWSSPAQGCCVVVSLIRAHRTCMSYESYWRQFSRQMNVRSNVFINHMEMSDRKRPQDHIFWICLHFTSWLNISTGIIDWHFYLNKAQFHSWSRHPSSLSFPHSRKSNSTVLNLSCHLCFISLKPQPKASASPRLCLPPPTCLLPHPACSPTQEEPWSLPPATRMLLTGS